MVIPSALIFIPLIDDNQWLIAIPICALISDLARALQTFNATPLLFVYGNKETPVQQILALEEDFKLSIDDAMRRFSSLLQSQKTSCALLTATTTRPSTKIIFLTNKSVLGV
ncbi:hypothetical protein O9993_01290 [Vibrio lentus]|nr:hypothetical protein [Vibrio lentus]